METINIKILPSGKIKIEAKGFKDPSCKNHLDSIEKLFGKADEVKTKPEGRIKAKKIGLKA